jgi:hypothetical protein
MVVSVNQKRYLSRWRGPVLLLLAQNDKCLVRQTQCRLLLRDHVRATYVLSTGCCETVIVFCLGCQDLPSSLAIARRIESTHIHTKGPKPPSMRIILYIIEGLETHTLLYICQGCVLSHTAISFRYICCWVLLQMYSVSLDNGPCLHRTDVIGLSASSLMQNFDCGAALNKLFVGLARSFMRAYQHYFKCTRHNYVDELHKRTYKIMQHARVFIFIVCVSISHKMTASAKILPSMFKKMLIKKAPTKYII